MDLDIKAIFAKRVRQRLKDMDQNANWLALETGISNTMISHFLNPERLNFPRFNDLREICLALGVSSDYLLSLPQPILPSSRSEMLNHVRNASTSMYGVHYATSYEDIHRWHQGDMKDFFEANQRLAIKKTVERIFLLRRYAFLDPQTRRFDELSKDIINEQGKTLSSVYVVWEEDARKWHDNEKSYSESGFDPSSSSILVNFVMVDEDILFLNRSPGYTVLTWIPDMTRCALRINDYLVKYNTLKSLSKLVTGDSAWWI